MKKVWFGLIAFILVGTGTLAFGQSYRGSRYNPYNPYTAPEQKTSQEKYPQESNYYTNPYGALSQQSDPRYYLYERDYLTRPYVSEFRKGISQDEYFSNPYGNLPRRWYDSEQGYSGGTYGKSFHIPGMLTSPFGEAYPRPSELNQTQDLVRERALLESDYTSIPYSADPRRWYDTQLNYQGTAQKTLEHPKTPSDPYSTKTLRSQSHEVLTSPFERAGSQSYGPVGSSQELTPPALK